MGENLAMHFTFMPLPLWLFTMYKQVNIRHFHKPGNDLDS